MAFPIVLIPSDANLVLPSGAGTYAGKPNRQRWADMFAAAKAGQNPFSWYRSVSLGRTYRVNLNDEREYRIVKRSVAANLVPNTGDGWLALDRAIKLGNVAATLGGTPIIRITTESAAATLEQIRASELDAFQTTTAELSGNRDVAPEDRIRIAGMASATGITYEQAEAIFLSASAQVKDVLFPFQGNALVQATQYKALISSGTLLSGPQLDAALNPTPGNVTPNASDPTFQNAFGVTGDYVPSGYARGELTTVFPQSILNDLVTVNAVADPTIIPGSPAAKEAAAMAERRKNIGLMILLGLPVLLVFTRKG